jgi:hypothetical protein
VSKVGVVLTKDNLFKPNWKGNKMCAESIQHLFLECHFAKFIWRAIQFTFNIEIPTSVVHMFNGWANSAGPQLRKFLLIGASALCWAMWTIRNNIVFDNSPLTTYMQVFCRGTALDTALGATAKA